MKTNIKQLLILLWACWMMVSLSSVGAQITSVPISLNGYGGTAFGITDCNDYQAGTADGNFDPMLLTIHFTAAIQSKLTVNAEVNLQDETKEKSTRLAYAFAEWAICDAFKIRIGRTMHSFGIFAEIFNVGTLRPFYMLPQSIYGPAEMTAEGFNGFSLTGNLFSNDANWGLQYDVYVGRFDYESLELWEYTTHENVDGHDIEIETEQANSIGGRLNIFPNIEGFHFGCSLYWGHNQPNDNSTKSHRSVFAIHTEYLHNRFSGRFELARLIDNDRIFIENVIAGYIEGTCFIDSHWQLAGRFDFSVFRKMPVTVLNTFIRHRDFAIGINYWFTPGFVIKSEYHYVQGNRFAIPLVLYPIKKTTTHLFQCSAQFAF